jgi:hypothetical protein
MLTSFFGKSNPINYLILAVLIFTGYILTHFRLDNNELNLSSGVKNIVLAAVCVLLMLLLDFILRKNHLTKNNTFGILLFTCFLLALPAIFLSPSILITNFFLFMAMRRILSLRTEKNIERKILDASLWISLASFFYFWSLLFFLLLYFSILRNKNTTHKKLLIPLVGFGVMFVLATSYYLIVSDSFAWFSKWKLPVSFDFSAYNSMDILLPATIIAALLVWTGLSRIFSLGSLQKKERLNAITILFSVLIALLVALATPVKTSAEILYILGPLVIVITNYIEITRESWFKEVLLWLAVLLPIIVFFL